jgi:phosphoribosyl 1,2-cyclic phosphodiesterase
MSLTVASLGSGSRGNAFLIETEDARLLVDAGFSGRELARRLEALDVDPESVDGVVVTHEHRDHTRGIGVGARRWGWPLYVNERTARACASLLKGEEQIEPMRAGRAVRVGTLEVHPVLTCHDAVDPVVVTVTDVRTRLKVGVATDLGRPTTLVRQAMRDCAFVVLESNHDERLLREGPYPWSVKQRIGGSRGHLSNRLAGEFARELAHPRMGGMLLAHLSVECNDPLRALDRVREDLDKVRYEGLLDAAPQEEPTPRYDVEALVRARTEGPQLSLFSTA